MKPFPLHVIGAIVLVASTGDVHAAAIPSGPSQSTTSAAPTNSEGGYAHQIYGIIRSRTDSQLRVETRDKRTVVVDASAAISTSRASGIKVGGFICAWGSIDANGVFHAQTVQRAKSSAVAWPADR